MKTKNQASVEFKYLEKTNYTVHFHCNYYPNIFRDIVVSNSSGKIIKLDVGQDRLAELRSWNAHNYEAWIVAGDKWNDHVIYSGIIAHMM